MSEGRVPGCYSACRGNVVPCIRIFRPSTYPPPVLPVPLTFRAIVGIHLRLFPRMHQPASERMLADHPLPDVAIRGRPVLVRLRGRRLFECLIEHTTALP